MLTNKPAHTYATPSRAVNSVEKLAVSRGGKEVRFVISKDGRGRYFPVFVANLKQVPDSEIEENPSANVVAKEGRGTRRRQATKGAATAARGTRRGAAKKANATRAKKATKRTARAKKTLH